MPDTPIYNHFDIQRYLQHKMSPQEMHAFEKALMDDPFLADAIEGYSLGDAGVADKHLATIETSIRGEKEDAKIVPLSPKKAAWWKIAAIVLVVITGSALTYSLFNNKHSVEMTTKAVAVTKPAISQGTPPDSISPINEPLAQAAPLAREKSVPAALQKRATKDKAANPSAKITHLETKKEQDQLVAMNNENQLMAAPSAPTPAKARVMMAAPQQAVPPQNEFKGVVTDPAGEPLPFARVRVDSTDIGTIADSKGNFTLKAPNSTANVTTTVVGYGTKKATIKTSEPVNKITMQKNEASLSDIVVTELLTRKKTKNQVHVTGDSATAATPANGWKNFEQYFNRQVDSLRAEGEVEMADQDIELEFSIDEKGRPVKIQTHQQVDKTLAEKAKQILSNGPSWKNEKKAKKVKVIISF